MSKSGRVFSVSVNTRRRAFAEGGRGRPAACGRSGREQDEARASAEGGRVRGPGVGARGDRVGGSPITSEMIRL